MAKKNIFKKTLAIALAAMLTLGAVPLSGLCGLELPSLSLFTASAAEEEPVWTVATDDMLVIEGNTITGYTDKLSGNIEIPTKTSNGTAITTIASGAFKGCTDITAVKISDSITVVGGSAFRGCPSLSYVYLDANCSFSGGDPALYATFADNNNLTTFVFGENITAIPANVCVISKALTTVVFKGKVTKIGESAFEGCTSLTDVDLSNVTVIGNSAFEGCTSIKSFTFSDNLKTIGSDAFYGCKMKDVVIPENVTSVGACAFRNCSELTTVTLNAANCSFSGGSPSLYATFAENDNLTTFVFGENITAIPANVCVISDAITTVVFKGKVTKIGESAFEGCTSLTNVDLSNVTAIGNSAFEECTSIKSFTFSDNLKTIGINAFYGCKMKEIVIPENVTSVGACAFRNCSELTTVTLNAANCSFSGGSPSLYATFAESDNLTTFVFGENVTAIPANVCVISDAITTVVFKGKVTKIEESAFEGCTSLTDVDLSNVTVIGNSAFEECTSIKSFTFSDNLKTIGINAFYGCKMKEIVIPENVTSVGACAFRNCSELTTVTLNAANCTFSGGSPSLYATFAESDNLTTFVFGENVTAIPANVCVISDAITTVVFEGEVTKIGQNAFYNCTSLSDVYCNAMRETDWNKVTVMSGNEVLDNVTMHFMPEILINNNSEKTELESAEEIVLSAELKYIETESAVEWFVNDIKEAEGEEFVFASEEGGKYEIKAVVADNDGLKFNDTIIVYVNYELKAEKDDVTTSCSGTAFDQKVKLSVTTDTENERENGSIAISDNEINEQICCFKIKTVLADDSSDATVQPNDIVTIKMAIPENYIGRTNFKIVHRLENGQRENFATSPKSGEKKLTVSSDGKYWIFEVTSFSDFEFFAVEAAPSVSIKNNTVSKTISYGETLRLTANTSNMPADAKIFWYVDGDKAGEGTTFEVSPESGNVEVTVRVVDADGNNYAGADISDSQKVSVKSGFFQKLISFFKNLFGISRIVAQAFMDK